MHDCLYIYVCAFQWLLCLLLIARNQFLFKHNVSIQCLFGRKFKYICKSSDFIKAALLLQTKLKIAKYRRERSWNKLIEICVKRISWNFVYSRAKNELQDKMQTVNSETLLIVNSISFRLRLINIFRTSCSLIFTLKRFAAQEMKAGKEKVQVFWLFYCCMYLIIMR